MAMPTAKPYVQVACVCEKVLIEPDNVASLIRIVDTFFLNLPAPQADFKAAVELTAFIALKSGDVVGEFEVGLRLTNPDGVYLPTRRWQTEFRGGEAGVNLKIAFSLPEYKLGLYWFDVLWGDEILTRIPFRLRVNPSQSTDDAVESTETVTH
jgi:hypothetical protein